jgi:DNA-binding transcriptional MerR regulator
MSVSGIDAMATVHRSIGEVLALLRDEFPDITISKIRFLESQGLVDPERTPSGYRRFYDKDIDRLRWILRQQREHYLPLKVIKDRLDDGEIDLVDPSPSAAAGVVDPPPIVIPEPIVLDPAPTVVTRVVPPPAPAAASPAAPDRPRVLPEPTLFAGRTVRDPAPAVVHPPASPRPSAAAEDLSSVSLTAQELADSTGLRVADIAELERFGLIEKRSAGSLTVYDGDALVVARLAAAFRAHGIESRHLRMFKVAADREAALVEQIVQPLVRQRTPEARRILHDTVTDLSRLTDSLHSVLLRGALRAFD